MIIMPIWNASHWLYSVIDISKQQIIVADSKRWYGPKFLNIFRNTIEEINLIFNPEKKFSWKFLDLSSTVPYQSDISSCGPLSVINCQFYTKNLETLYRIDDIVDILRENICLSVFVQLQLTKHNKI